MTQLPPGRNEGHHVTPLFLRPRVIFPILAAVIISSVLLAPKVDSGDQQSGLTTHSTGPFGASGFAETVRRFGWRVAELDEAASDTLSPNAVYAVLTPSANLTVSETHVFLDLVRAGAGLIAILGGGPLQDSLHLAPSARTGMIAVPHDDSVACPAHRTTLQTLATSVPLYMNAIQASAPITNDTVHIARIRTSSTDSLLTRAGGPAVLGMTLGRGRIVVIPDGRLFANDFIRVCRWGAGVTAIRAIEWVAERSGGARRDSVVFDEFYHGFGSHASVTKAVGRWFAGTLSGRTAAQLCIAALILLLAAAPRAIAPLPRANIARRSPLEHVAALAQAYEQVRATRTAATILVQGLRRRAPRSAGARSASDDQFLETIATRLPALKADTDRARNAMGHQVPPAELLDVAATIDRIERSVRT